MDRTASARRLPRRALIAAPAILLASLATPAAAAPEPSARLVRCGEQSCLRIVGRRVDPASAVRINGRAVETEGHRRWKVDLPVETVRDWSEPNARTIEVALQRSNGEQETAATVDLPIGLLATELDLASLVVTAG